jgi:predicted O-methyltransferase YrrM
MTRTADRLQRILLPENPYDGFPVDQYAADEGDGPQGWGHRHWVFDMVLRDARPRTIFEVGTWKGGSAIKMAQLCKELRLDAAIVCVDTWLGSPEHIRKPDRNRWTDSLNRRWGYPQLYHTFMANVLKWECEDIIVPYPATSENAAVVFTNARLKADLVYIDAAHEYEPALRDYTAYWELLNDGGYLIGDDYIGWPGVTRAADEFARIKNSPLVGGRGKFVMRKNAPLPPELGEAFDEAERKRVEREAAEAAAAEAQA